VKTTYGLAGLRIVSDFPLPGLQICLDAARARDEVVIRHAHIPEALASATATFRNGHFIGSYDGKEVLLDIAAAGRFLVREGKEILMDRVPSSDDGEVRAYLLGTALGLLCHQRGVTPLHASAIDVADGCVAFVGVSGAGKSTLIAALARRGHRVISDDVCFLRLAADDTVQAWPGVTRIRLWEEAKAALGYDGPGVEREMHGYNKYFVPVRPPPNPSASRRLRRVYQLHGAADGATRVARLRGGEAVDVLLQNVYRLSFAERLGYKPHAFKFCALAARDVSVYRFSRPLDFSALGRGIELLESHLQSIT
jgi:hypothetical protein